jgi:hypothetical protein
MPAVVSKIWLPGAGMTDLSERRVDAAVKEYDENLRFGRNEETGQYCIFLIRRGFDPLPILGFNEIPHPEDAVKKLWRADAMRRGNEILDEMNKENEEARKADEYAADEGIGQAAEGFEWLMRTQGQTPYTKSYDISHKRNKIGGYS